MGKITSILKSLLKLALAVSLLLFLLWLPLWYFAKPVNDFCNNITKQTTYENILLRAKELNYRVTDNLEGNNGSLSVESRDSPLFRMACFVTFKDKKVINKQVRNSD